MYGRGDTPIGLSAGYRNPNGGVQLQVAVNGSLIAGETAQKLTIKGLGFYDLFSSPVQPSFGLGFQINPDAPGNVQPALSFGFATDIERLVLLGGFDVVEATPEVAIVYNFRHESNPTSGATEESPQ